MAMAYPLSGNVTVSMPQGPTGATGSSGASYTTGLGAGTGLAYTNGTWSNQAIWTNPNPKVNITDSDIVLDGLSLRETLKTLMERMAILQPNPKLEKDFEQLRELREQYEALEKELLEKAKTWDTLKNTDR